MTHLTGESMLASACCPVRISVIIPAYNAASTLTACLTSLAASTHPPFECIVVDDGSSDESSALAARHGVTVLSTGGRRGPACARNRGAAAARGQVLVFLDADVCVHTDTLARIAAAFDQDPALDALIGSYDDEPSAPDFLSQYKNLMHCYMHQTARREACIFWSGCGAIRTAVFRAHGGFDESISRPAMEDVELGYRLIGAGRKVLLDKLVQARHLKRWTLRSLLQTDIFDRAVPWTRLIVQSRFLPDDLNVRWSQRISAALALLLAVLLVGGPWWLSHVVWLPASLGLLLAVLALNLPFYRFLAARRSLFFAVAAVPLQLAYLVYSPVSFLLAAAYYGVKLRDSPSLRDAEADQ